MARSMFGDSPLLVSAGGLGWRWGWQFSRRLVHLLGFELVARAAETVFGGAVHLEASLRLASLRK